MKNIDLIEQKLCNFLAYVDQHCPPELKTKFEPHKGISADRFMLEFIAPHILPNKHKLDGVIDFILGSANLTRDKVGEEVIEKIKLYLQFFCEILLK